MFAEWGTDAASMAAHQIDLQLLNLFRRDTHGGHFAEAGVDAVGGGVRFDHALDDGSRRQHLFAGGRSDGDLRAVEHDGVEIFESEMFAVELDSFHDYSRGDAAACP